MTEIILIPLKALVVHGMSSQSKTLLLSVYSVKKRQQLARRRSVNSNSVPLHSSGNCFFHSVITEEFFSFHPLSIVNPLIMQFLRWRLTFWREHTEKSHFVLPIKIHNRPLKGITVAEKLSCETILL